jgi:hypothetical protein
VLHTQDIKQQVAIQQWEDEVKTTRIDQENLQGNTGTIQSEGTVKEGQGDEFVYKRVPARTATKVMIPASLDGSKAGAAPFEGLLLAEGVATVPVDEDGVDPDPDGDEDDELLPVAAALKASNDLLAVGFTAKTIPA